MQKLEVKTITQTVTLEVKDLFKSYNEGEKNEVKVLKGVNLTLYAGQMVAIMGPSGCGKTTLLNLIGGLDGITSGVVSIKGRDISIMADKELTDLRGKEMGFIFQSYNLFEQQTALENVMLPLLLQDISTEMAIARSKMMLQEVGLGDKFNELPGKLSGGEAQKVAISRSLVTEPLVVLADEPTAELSMAMSDDILSLFRRMQRENPETTIILVTHSEHIASQCDRIIRIEDGMVSADEEVHH
ncbi:MAG: ABC transporter ATP-binding protein [Candidatus Heimdallarchaeota archaeon]|nr:ABC transporter ATP-binding protein [Candidatus Heimdallarchaeota archaeon]